LKIAAQFYFIDCFPLLLFDLFATEMYHYWQEIPFNNASSKDSYLFKCGVHSSDILCLVFGELALFDQKWKLVILYPSILVVISSPVHISNFFRQPVSAH